MASNTEGTYIGDLVKQEVTMHASREEILVDASQTLVFGDVCKKGPGGRMQALAAGVNEVQLIGITGTLSAGSFTLGVPLPDGGVEWTDPIAYNANTAGIQAGIDTTVIGGSQIVVGGTAITAMTFTFSGTLMKGIGHPLLQINTQGLTGEEDTSITRTTAGGGAVAAVDEVQTMSITGTESAGTYTLTFVDANGDTVTTAAIAYNGNLAAVQAAIDAVLLPTQGVVASGTPLDNTFVLTFSGEHYEGRDQTLVTVDITSLTGVTACTFVETTKGGPATAGEAYGVLITTAGVTTGAGALTTKGLFIVRDAILDVAEMDFREGNKIDAIAQLAERAILCRTAAEIAATQTT